MDFFNYLYYCKKAMLMAEFLDGNFERVNKTFEATKPLLRETETIEELTAATEQYLSGLKSLIPDEKYEEFLYSDYEVYTDKFYHRKFWNEIENHFSIDEFLEKFLSIFDAENEPECFVVSLYDFNDYDIPFANEEDLESFLNNFDVAPFTVFEIDGTSRIELYSA